ncbi:hypothetical protein LNO81_22630 [Klebsiella variicola subsp. variicola]|nr:hypothetical protein [Klebsiella variicola subsp. variicola]
MEIAYTYDDAGKSGVSIVGRHSLQQLLSDVEQKKIDIQAVLFCDVEAVLVVFKIVMKRHIIPFYLREMV